MKRIPRSEEHTSELQSHDNLVCRLLLEKKIHRRQRGRADRGRSGREFLIWRVGGARVGRAFLLSLGGRPPARLRGAQGPAFFFNDAPTAEIYPLSLPHPVPI